MIARDKFQIGQRVQLTKLGKRMVALGSGARAHVIDFTRDPAHVVVEPEDYPDRPLTCHMDHWEPAGG